MTGKSVVPVIDITGNVNLTFGVNYYSLAEGRYEFVSDISLTDGDARIEILKGRQAVAVLTAQNKTAVLNLPKGRYTILTRYRKADGSLKVEWKQI